MGEVVRGCRGVMTLNGTLFPSSAVATSQLTEPPRVGSKFSRFHDACYSFFLPILCIKDLLPLSYRVGRGLIPVEVLTNTAIRLRSDR